MTETQLFFLAGSGVKEIRKGGTVTSWGWGSAGRWAKLKDPKKSSYKKVKYNKKNKSKAGKVSGWKLGSNNTVCGTVMPKSAVRQVDGVERTVDVRYRVRGYTFYSKKKKVKKKSVQYKTTYTTAKPYQYQLQYKDKPSVATTYSTFKDTDGKYYAYFSPVYYDGDTQVSSPSRMKHPTSVNVTYGEVRKNLNSTANNNESRDNSGTYVYTNVRSNIVTLELEWAGLNPEEGQELLNVLNATNTYTGVNETTLKNNYIIAQYLDPQTGKAKNGTFYPSDRKVEKYPNGMYKTVSVTLTEV